MIKKEFKKGKVMELNIHEYSDQDLYLVPAEMLKVRTVHIKRRKTTKLTMECAVRWTDENFIDLYRHSEILDVEEDDDVCYHNLWKSIMGGI